LRVLLKVPCANARTVIQDTVQIGNCATYAQAHMLIAMADSPIERAEVVALLFNVSDIAVTLTNIERPLGENDGEEETDEG
jgi:hypothetical protein